MNKKIIIIIFALVLVLSAFFVFNQNTKDINVTNENNSVSDAIVLEKPVENITPTSVYYSVVLNESTLNWTAKKTVVADWIDKGTINISSGRIALDGNNIVAGEIVVDMNSIQALTTGSGTNQDRLTNHLKSPDFFDAKIYPASKFIITSVSGNRITGNLTIKDVTKSISFPVSVSKVNNGSVVSGKISVNRADFGVKYGSTSFFKNLADRAIVDDIFTVDFSVVVK